MYDASQNKNTSPSYDCGPVETAHTPITVSSPTSVRSPLLRQRRVTCFEEQLRDREDDAGLFHRTNSDSVELCNAAASSISKTLSGVMSVTSSLNVDGESGGADLKRSGSPDSMGLSQRSFSQSEEAPPGSESPFTPIRCSFELKAGLAGSAAPPSLTLNSESFTNKDGVQLELKRSPKLEHKAVARVKSMMSTEVQNLSQQQKSRAEDPSPCLTTSQSQTQVPQGRRNSRPAPGLEPQHQCKKGEASELSGVCTIDSVTLWRKEDESYGLDLEITSSPLKVLITGLKPGGAADRVGTTGCSQLFQSVSFLKHKITMTHNT